MKHPTLPALGPKAQQKVNVHIINSEHSHEFAHVNVLFKQTVTILNRNIPNASQAEIESAANEILAGFGYYTVS